MFFSATEDRSKVLQLLNVQYRMVQDDKEHSHCRASLVHALKDWGNRTFVALFAASLRGSLECLCMSSYWKQIALMLLHCSVEDALALCALTTGTLHTAVATNDMLGQ